MKEQHSAVNNTGSPSRAASTAATITTTTTAATSSPTAVQCSAAQEA